LPRHLGDKFVRLTCGARRKRARSLFERLQQFENEAELDWLGVEI
jgi:hypothetical protein